MAKYLDENGLQTLWAKIKGTMPTALKNPNALTFGSKTYDGSSAQTITASDLGALTSHQNISGKVNKSGDTMTGKLTIQSGDASGCLQIGANAGSNTLTTNARKLARVTFPTKEYNTTKTCSVMSCDNNNGYNYIEFGGHIGDTTNTAPDFLYFNVDKTHNSLSVGTKECVMAISPTSLNLFNGSVDSGTISSFTSLSSKWIFNNSNTFKNNGYTYTLPNTTGTIALTSNIPTALKNPNALTFGSKTYDGSSAQTITASDLDLPSFDDVGSWHEGQIMVASSQNSIINSTVDITDITDDIIALKTDSHTHSNKSVLDNITAIDASLSSTSTNPVQNKAIYTALNAKADDQLPMEITTTEGDSFRSVGDAIVGINDAMLIMASEIPNYSSATSSALGLVKLGSDTVQSTSANSVTSTASRTYAIQKNSSGQLVVNVPWSATSVTIPSNLVLYNNDKYAYGTTGSWEFYQKASTSNKCNIVYGTVSINKASFYNQTVTFAKSLPSSNYSVILTATISNNTASREVFTSVYSRSTTGFVCNGHMGNTSYKIVSLHYIAIYNS